MDGDQLYAWQVQEQDGRWSMVGAMLPGMGEHVPLIHWDSAVVVKMRTLAYAHAAETKQPLRLVKFMLAEILEENP